MGLLNKFKKDKKEEGKKKADEKSAKVDSVKKESMKEMYEGKSSPVSSAAKVADGKNAVDGKKGGKRKYGNAHRILVKPLVTEKASVMGPLNKYFFEVARDANKIETAKAIQDVYGVKPVSINIIRMRGKSVRHGRTMGKRKDWKKAIVTLRKGESIKIYEGV